MKRLCIRFSLSILIMTAAGYALTAQDLSVMTYNIRYGTESDGENAWSKRKDELATEILFFEPEIFGIQEGLATQVHYLDSALSDYAYIGVGRDDGKEAGEFSAIFYKKEQLKVLQSGTFWLSETPEKPAKGWDAVLPRICTYGLFQVKGKKFWMFNAHFDHIGKEAQVNSMKLILAKINEFNPKNYPVIFTGDLNSKPEEAAVTEMKTQLKDAREVAQLVFGPDASFNGFRFDEKPSKRIDYVAVNEGFAVLKYAILTNSFDQKYISDHFPVFCRLHLN